MKIGNFFKSVKTVEDIVSGGANAITNAFNLAKEMNIKFLLGFAVAVGFVATGANHLAGISIAENLLAFTSLTAATAGIIVAGSAAASGVLAVAGKSKQKTISHKIGAGLAALALTSGSLFTLGASVNQLTETNGQLREVFQEQAAREILNQSTIQVRYNGTKADMQIVR